MAKKEQPVLNLEAALAKVDGCWTLTPNQKTLFKEVLSALVGKAPTKAKKKPSLGVVLTGQPLSAFKLGMRVVVLDAVDGKDEWINDIGTVMAKRSEGDRLNVGVDFHEHKEGRHKMEGRLNTSTGWWCECSSLGILAPKPKKEA